MATSLDEMYPLRGTLQTLGWGVRTTGIGVDTSLDEKYPLRGTLQTLRWGVRTTGIIRTDSSMES